MLPFGGTEVGCNKNCAGGTLGHGVGQLIIVCVVRPQFRVSLCLCSFIGSNLESNAGSRTEDLCKFVCEVVHVDQLSLQPTSRRSEVL